MAAEGVIVRFVYRGGGWDTVPRSATHVTIDDSVTVIPTMLFYEHPNIVEVDCHAGVMKIESMAFQECPRLERLILPGVEIMEELACRNCDALTYIECPKLEKIELSPFENCRSLSSIDLQSARVVEGFAFTCCRAMEYVEFGTNLESVGERTFLHCPSLERIAIPLKNDLLPHDRTFQLCENLRHVHFVEEEVLNETVNALLLDEWKNDMRRDIGSINHNLPNAPASFFNGEKTIVIREWIRSVLSKIIYYKAQHRRLLKEAAATLQLFLPNDTVVNNVLPFVELPAHTFDGEEDDDWLEG